MNVGSQPISKVVVTLGRQVEAVTLPQLVPRLTLFVVVDRAWDVDPHWALERRGEQLAVDALPQLRKGWVDNAVAPGRDVHRNRLDPLAVRDRMQPQHAVDNLLWAKKGDTG